MKKIICRFDSIEPLIILSNKIEGISTSVTEFDLDSMKVLKVKKESKKTFKSTDKHMCIDYFKEFPEFQSKKIESFHKIVFHTTKELSEISELFNQNVTEKTKSIWFPKLVPGKNSSYRVVGGSGETNYPIYVVSKGRKDNCTTSEYLSRMEVSHFVVVEPFEVDSYKESLENDFAKVLEMDLKFKDDYDTFSDLGNLKSTGPGAARNFCWEHSIKNNFKRHWVMDDNANEGFHLLHQNNKIKCRSGAYFKAIENWVDRFENIAIAGLNYTKFAMEPSKSSPYTLNTRIYSFLLIDNSVKYRWRGRYNEDTDLSLRVLKDGLCTVQFNSFLAGKVTTQKVKGGNTEEFYDAEGTMNKSKMLADMHPDVAEVVWKFNRWHHSVDYTGYKQKLKPLVDFKLLKRVDNLGLKIINTDETSTKNSKSFLEKKYSKKLLPYKKTIFHKYEDGGMNLLDSNKKMKFIANEHELSALIKYGKLAISKLFKNKGGSISKIMCKIPKTNFCPIIKLDDKDQGSKQSEFSIPFDNKCYEEFENYIKKVVKFNYINPSKSDYEKIKTKIVISVLKKISKK
jgi:hypothetical protein